jgi:ABC-2 type transport system permease protein
VSGLLPVWTLWQREVLRFLRQRGRVVSSVLQPALFWLLLGAGLRASFRPPGLPGGASYMEYFYPGTLAMVILFTAIFSTISVVEDRREGFLQGVLVAPVPRSLIVLGQCLGGTTLALFEGMLFLLLAPLSGIRLTAAAAGAALGSMALLGLEMTGLGLIIAWRMESTQGFHAIMNLILMPLWLLSGSFFPADGTPGWLAWVMRLNPVTYGVAALRRCLYLGEAGRLGDIPGLAPSLLITAATGALVVGVAAVIARRRA